MKFSTLLKSNRPYSWEEFYCQYNLIKNDLKTDKSKFEDLLSKDFIKISNFYYDIEMQTLAQKECLFEIISDSITEEVLQYINENNDQLEKSHKRISKFTDDEGYSYSEAESLYNESEISIGGEESDIETGMESTLADVAKVENLEFNRNDQPSYFDKKKGFNFENFKINKPFERRKKEKSFHELLQAINFVKSYRDINYMGLSILIKKYKKAYPRESFGNSFLKRLHSSHFHKSKKIDRMQKEVKFVYKKVFAKDDKKKAYTIFKKIGRKTKYEPWVACLVGSMVTASLFLFWNTNFEKHPDVMRVSYSIGSIHYGAFLFGLCVFLFKKVGINYKLIFNFDVISSMNSVRYLSLISSLLLINFGLCFLFIDLFPLYLKLFLILFNICIIFMPIDIVFYKSRMYFISVFFGTPLSVFRVVYFKYFFFADISQSFVPCVKNIYIELGLPVNLPVLIVIFIFFPFLRMTQCFKRYLDTKESFPHLLNLAKYILVVLTGIVNAFYSNGKVEDYRSFKLFFSFISMTYCLLWDFIFDWAVYRDVKLFPSYYYIISIFYNIIARYIPIASEYIYINEFVKLLIEITRRFIWTLFRVEIEHLNNCREIKSKMNIFFSKELFYIQDVNGKEEVEFTDSNVV